MGDALDCHPLVKGGSAMTSLVIWISAFGMNPTMYNNNSIGPVPKVPQHSLDSKSRIQYILKLKDNLNIKYLKCPDNNGQN